MPKFIFPSNRRVTFSPNHWSNLEVWKSVQSNFLSIFVRQQEGAWLPRSSLIIMNTFKGQGNKEMKWLCAKNNCELVIVPHNLTNKFQPLDISINQSAKKFISNKFNAWYADRVVNCQMELQLAMLKYPSNWVIWNLFMLGGLLRHTVISNTKMTPLSKFSMLQGSARLSHVQTTSSHEKKTLSMNRDSNRIFSSFFVFFMKT